MKTLLFNRRMSGVRWMSAMLGIFFMVSAVGCRKSDSITTPPDNSTVTTTLAGRITDENGKSLAAVTVTAAGKTAMTDDSGLFAIADVTVPSGRAFVIASKSGYFNSARAANPSAGKVTYMQLSLASSATVGSVNATTGGTVSIPTGGKLMLAPNGVVTSSGAAYSGTVSVSARHLDPADAKFSDLFAGDLVGEGADGKQTVLTSAGVIIAELHGSSGELLQPAPGSPATLTMPITAAQLSTAPATVPFWSFDEALGMWKEEGSATKVGNTYTGTVKHFTPWNYDWGGPWGTIKGRILCNGAPIPGVVVDCNTSGQQPITDEAGEFTARVPAVANRIVIQVLGPANNGKYFMLTGHPVAVPANVTTDFGDFSLDSPCPCELKGRLTDCNNVGVPGMILASWTGGMSYVYSKDGSFSLVVGSGQQIRLAGTTTTGVAIQPQTITSGGQGSTLAVNLSACVDQTSDVLMDIPGSYFGQAVALSPDGSKIAVASKDGSDVVILDTKTKATLGTLPQAFTGGVQDTVRTNMIKFSPDGSKVLTCRLAFYYQTSFDVWKTDGTRLTAASIVTNSDGACFSKDGASILYYIFDTVSQIQRKGIAQYDIASGTTGKTYAVIQDQPSVVGLAANGTQLVTISHTPSYHNQVSLWDLTADKSISNFPILDSAYYWYIDNGSIGLSTDGSTLGASTQASLSFYNTATGKKLNASQISTPYAGEYRITPDGSFFIGQYRAGVGNTVAFFNTSDGAPTKILDAPVNAGYSTGVALSSDGKVATAVYGTVIRIWTVK